jgi:hypothetical protein
VGRYQCFGGTCSLLPFSGQKRQIMALKYLIPVRFEVLTVVIMKHYIFWDIMLCSLLTADISEEHAVSVTRGEV